MALLSGLSKTRRSFFDKIKDIVTFKKEVDEKTLERLEEIFLSSDLGVDVTVELLDRLRARVRDERLRNTDQILAVVKDEMKSMLKGGARYDWFTPRQGPLVLLVVGVNGAGKTTTIGKLSHFFGKAGKKVLLGACDTFRAAAIEQLETWAKRAGVEIVMQKQGSDSAAVAFDALAAARARNCHAVIIDTAGRLHTKANLMAELRKIKTVLTKREPGLTVRTLLVLDGTNGQNALNQAREFNDTAEIDGLIVTKLDGTAKGGAVFAISRLLQVPVEFIGTGEALEDIEVFDAGRFVDAFFAEGL